MFYSLKVLHRQTGYGGDDECISLRTLVDMFNVDGDTPPPLIDEDDEDENEDCTCTLEGAPSRGGDSTIVEMINVRISDELK